MNIKFPVIGTLALLFFQCLENADAAEAGDIFPRGKVLPFLGYSGEPARDLTNGFTVAGPVYGNQMPYLQKCFSNGWPVVAHVGPHITFNDKSPDKYKLNEATLRAEVEKQIRELAPHQEIVWWAITPEELRTWRKDEMKYFDLVCDGVRKNDPLHRPLYLYNPNHRDAKSLEAIAKQVDVLGKGCYVNSSGKKRDRAWVRWSVEQELAALQAVGRPQAIAVVMPELCKDPEPAEESEIRAWVRHDVYLGLASGAKGVFIWALFKRKEVKHSWQLWYDAYAECARELNGPRGLAQIFLFGKQCHEIKVELVKGGGAVAVQLGGNAEPTTTTEQERAAREVKMASWTSAEYLQGGARWFFLINSANTPATFQLSKLPPSGRCLNAFDGAPLVLEHNMLTLPAYGVVALKFAGEKK
ncbi:MAG: hypothetical protein NTY53_08655 [Kiritimatiellaeota bacterium]|nr:hypothetical protein [Kiritimatiellota bacterium]